MLQRATGNQAVARLLGRNSPRPQNRPSTSGLRVGPVGDRYEQEAERISRQVIAGNPHHPRAMPSPTVGKVQKSPVSKIQCLIDLEEFRSKTNKGTLRRRGDILTAIDTLLKQFAAYPILVKNEIDRAHRKDVLAEITRITNKWIERHDVKQMDVHDVDDQAKSNSRAETLAAIVT